MKNSLNNYPDFVEIADKEYKINTDFRVALRCNEISMDDTITEDEKNMAMVYLLFGEKGIEDQTIMEILVYYAYKFLLCQRNFDEEETENNQNDEEPDMDFIQDMPFIEASFMSDYHIDLEHTEMHFWKFMDLINGLTDNEMGNCCILNKIRNIRRRNLQEIDDPKERKEVENLQKRFALKRHKKEKEFTEEEIKNMEEFHRLIDEERK